jgi:hypothetical protein
MFPLFRLYAWTKDDRATQVTTSPISIFYHIDSTLNISAPGSIVFSCFITDNNAIGLEKGHWYELYIGKNQDPASDISGGNGAPWSSGYIQDLKRNPAIGGTFDITAASPMMKLATRINTSNMQMNFTTDDPSKTKQFNKGYRDVMFALNGLDGSGNMGSPNIAQGPGMKGILTGTGWVADYSPSPKPDPKNTPGHGDSWLTSFESILKNVQLLATHYNLFFRERPGSVAGTGIIDFGLLGDDSGVKVWGGKPLKQKMMDLGFDSDSDNTRDVNAFDAQLHGFAVIAGATYEDSAADVVNTVFPAGAGRNPFVSIGGAGGTGSGPQGAGFFPPIRDRNGNINSIDASPRGRYDYYQKYQNPSNGRVYWKVRPNVKIGNTTYLGQVYASDDPTGVSSLSVFRLVAIEDNNGGFDYGVMNEYSVGIYGVYEQHLFDSKIKDPRLLLSAAIGAAEYNSEPVPSWTLTVRHPMTSATGVPDRVLPGQTIDVQYEGVIHQFVNLDADGNITLGTPVKGYLKFPTKDDLGTKVNGVTIDSGLWNRMRKVVTVEELWSDQGYVATYTMGKGKFHGKHWADHIAAKFEHHQRASHKKHTVDKAIKHHNFDNVAWLMDYGAHFDSKDGTFYIPGGSGTWPDPGGVVVSDTKHGDVTFDEHTGITFTFALTDKSQFLDFWIQKPPTSALVDHDVADDDSYGIIRFAGNGSGQTSGFFIKNPICPSSRVDAEKYTDLSTYLFYLRSPSPGNPCPNSSGPPSKGNLSPYKVGHGIAKRLQKDRPGFQVNVNYTATITFSGGTYTCHVKYAEKDGKKQIMVNRLLAIYHDTSKYLDRFGAIGWRVVGGQNADPVPVAGLAVHPIHHKASATTHDSGGGGSSGGGEHPRSEIVVSMPKSLPGKTPLGGGLGHRVYEYDDDSDGLNSKNYLIHSSSGTHTHSLDKYVHTAHLSKVGITSTVAAGSSLISLNQLFDPQFKRNGLPPMTLTPGYRVTFWDGEKTETLIVDYLIGQNGQKITSPNDLKTWIYGIQTKEITSYSHTPSGGGSIELGWDHLERGADYLGHAIASSYEVYNGDPNNPRSGYYHVLIPAGMSRANAFSAPAVAPDGSLRVGGKFIQDAQGNIINIAQQAVDADQWALGVESHGVVLFDSGEYGSTTQKVWTYADGTNIPTLYFDASNSSDPNHQSFFGFTGPSSTVQAGWLEHHYNAAKGIGDAVLQLTTSAANTAVLWQDRTIYDEKDSKGNIKQKTYNVTKDVGLHCRVWIDPSYVSSTSPLMGAHSNLSGAATIIYPIGTTSIPIRDDVSTLGVHTSPTYDTWVINPGDTGETVTVTGIDTITNSLLLQNPTTIAHYGGDIMEVATYGGVAVNTGSTFGDGTSLDDKQVAINIVSIGFMDSNNNWYRGWFGDLSYTPPWVGNSHSGTTGTTVKAVHLGKLSALAGGGIADLYAKTSTLGMYKPGQTPITIVGMELGIHSSVSNAPLTVTFDAFEHGHATAPNTTPSGIIGGAATAIGAIGHPQKNPSAHEDAHIKSDMFFWASKNVSDGKWVIHWEHDTLAGSGTQNPGSIITHASQTHKYLVYAGPRADSTSGAASENHPNIGVPAMPIINSGGTIATLTDTSSNNQTDINNIKGHYLVFNANSSGFFVNDPGVSGGKVWIPGYVQGSTGTQTSGFGVVTEKFNWQNRKSGGAILQGAHEDFYKVGKIGTIQDPHTKELHILGHGPNLKKSGKSTRQGSIGKQHLHDHHPAKHQHEGIVYSVDSTGKTPNGTSPLQATFHANKIDNASFPVLIKSENGATLGSLSTNVFINQIQVGDYLVWDTGNTSGLAAGLYCYRASGSYSPSWPAIVPATGATVTGNAIASSGPMYNASGALNFHKDDLIDHYVVARVAPAKDATTGHLFLMGHQPASHQSHGVHYANESHGRAAQHPHQPTKHNHHGLIYSFTSRGKSPNSSTQCTFHANLAPNTTAGWVETVDGKKITIPSSGGLDSSGNVTASSNIFINLVQGHDYIIYDDGSSTGLSAGFYCVRNSGTNAGTFTVSSNIISAGPFYSAGGSFNSSHVTAIGVHIIGRVSPSFDAHTKQFAFEGHHSGPHQAHGAQQAPHSTGTKHLNKHHPTKKKRRKKVLLGSPKKIRHTFMRAV